MSSVRASQETLATNDEESQFLVTSERKKNDFTQNQHYQKLKRSSKWHSVYYVVLHGLLVVFALAALWPSSRQMVSNGSWSPAEKYLEYGIQASYEMHSKYAGLPNQDVKDHWDALAKPIYFNASAADLQKAGVPLTNRTRMAEGGYLSSLGILHELHCLQMFRFFIYFDHYYGNVSESSMVGIRAHLDHCLDNIRSSLMCKPNTKLITFNWNQPEERKPEHESHSQSQCVKWSSMEAWTKSVGITADPLFWRVAPVDETDELE